MVSKKSGQEHRLDQTALLAITGTFTFQTLLTPGTQPVHIKREELRFKCGIPQIAYLGHKRGVFHRSNATTGSAHQMVVTFGGTRKNPFILRRLIAELMPAHQAGLKKQLYGSIHCGKAEMPSFKRKRLMQRIYIKMGIRREHFLKNGITFGGAPHTVLFQICIELGSCRCKHLVVGHGLTFCCKGNTFSDNKSPIGAAFS